MSKAGGLARSEVLAHGVSLLMLLPVPGQKQWNATHGINADAGIGAESAAQIASAPRGDERAVRAIANPAAARWVATSVLADRAHHATEHRPRAAARSAR